MPDIGIFELLLIGILLFVVVGPERMPEFFGQIGRWARFARNWWTGMRGEVMREIEKESAPIREVGDSVRRQVVEIRDEVAGGATESDRAGKPKPPASGS